MFENANQCYSLGCGVGFVFCSHQSSVTFSSGKSAEANLKNLIKDLRASAKGMSVWGHFDYVAALYSNSTDELLKLSRISPGIGPGIDNFKVILGNTIYSDESFVDYLTKDQLPLKAICSFKCNKSFIDFSKVGENRISVNDLFNEFIETSKIEAENIRKNSRDKFLIQIIFTYSWADFIVFIQSNSLFNVKNYILNLRRTTFNKPTPGKRHLFFYTDTTIGVSCLSGLDPKNDVAKIVKNLKPDKMLWNINIRLRPGHSSKIEFELRKSRRGITTKVMTFLGGYDITIWPNCETTFPEFIHWYFNVFTPAAGKESSSILKTKTNFYMDFLEGKEKISSFVKQEKEFEYRKRALSLSEKHEGYVPNHILSALVNLSTSFDFLVNQHETIKAEFATVSNAFNFYLNYFEAEIVELARKFKGREGWINLIERSCEILDEFSHILSERFREGHLVGDVHFEIPSVTYSGSFQKSLQAIENFVMKLILNAGLQLQPFCYDKAYEPLIQVACSVRNNESPSNSIYFNSGFIHIPLDSLVFQETWFYIIHETGHILLDELITLLKTRDPELLEQIRTLDELTQEMITELFADAFTVKLLFQNNIERYFDLLFNYYCRKLNKWDIPEYRVDARRFLLEKWIQLRENDQFTFKPSDYSSLLEKIDNQHRKADFERAFKKFLKLVKKPFIVNWYRALRALDTDMFDEEINNNLKLISEMAHLAHKVFVIEHKSNTEHHDYLKTLRRRIFYDLWYDSMVSDYATYYESGKAFSGYDV